MEAIRSVLLFITLSFLLCCIEANSFGFSTNLIHRDSIFSPYFDSSKTYYENVRNSILRSKERSAYFSTPKLDSSPSSIISSLTPIFGEYLMSISVGTPPVDLLAIVDTASAVVWTQCEPCDSCYVQDTPKFNPQNSSTYQKQSCKSDVCQSSRETSCNIYRDENCNYGISYMDGSYSLGNLSSETFTFLNQDSGTPFTLPNIYFGCGYSNGGFFSEYTTGVVGLGHGNLSLINQLSDIIHGKFLYCFVPLNAPVLSLIAFGNYAVVSGDGVQTTSLYTTAADPFYRLPLEKLAIGNTTVNFNVGGYDQIIIDSGTALTFLPKIIYLLFEDEFKSRISATPIGARGGCNLCYNKEPGFEQKVPILTFHFTGMELDLDATNTLLEVEEGVLCLAILPLDGGYNIPIFGNVMQRNYKIGYDLVSMTVSFKKSDCSDW